MSTAEKVADILRTRILQGYFPPGDRLAEGAIGGALGVSRNTLREAFRLLGHEGLLVQELNRGVFVRVPTMEDVVDIYRVRRFVEGQAVRGLTPESPVQLQAAGGEPGPGRRRQEGRGLAGARHRQHRLPRRDRRAGRQPADRPDDAPPAGRAPAGLPRDGRPAPVPPALPDPQPRAVRADPCRRRSGRRGVPDDLPGRRPAATAGRLRDRPAQVGDAHEVAVLDRPRRHVHRHRRPRARTARWSPTSCSRRTRTATATPPSPASASCSRCRPTTQCPPTGSRRSGWAPRSPPTPCSSAPASRPCW